MIFLLRSILGVALFELRRSFSPARLSIWFLVAFFPMCLILMVRSQAGSNAPDEAYAVILFFLIVRVASTMGLLLWATPLVSNEIEGRTWLYVTTRPYGSGGIVLGKYLVAILWSLSAGLVSALSATLASGVDQMLRTWLVMTVLVTLGCLSYGALFTLIGALVQKRAMVVAIVYTVIVEGILSIVPATINRFTISYRLLGLMLEWMQFEPTTNERYVALYGDTALSYHLMMLTILTPLFLGIAVYRVRQGGYLSEAED